MKRYIIFVVLALIGEYGCQVVISHISGPAVIRNVHSTIENGTSVVNVVHETGNDDTSIISTDSSGPVVIQDISSTVIDGSSVVNDESYVHTHTSASNEDHTGVWVVSSTQTGTTENPRHEGNKASGIFKGCFWHFIVIYLLTYFLV